MKREELLEQGFSEEQVSKLLDMFHDTNAKNAQLEQDLANANSQISTLNTRIDGLAQMETEYNNYKQSQLTEQEKIAIKEKEIETRLANARKTDNRATAKEMLSEIGGVSEEVLNSIVTDDAEQTKKNATALLNQIKSVKTETEIKAKQELSSLDIKPNPSNDTTPQEAMTWEKFDTMTAEEQSKFAEEHPDEFAKI